MLLYLKKKKNFLIKTASRWVMYVGAGWAMWSMDILLAMLETSSCVKKVYLQIPEGMWKAKNEMARGWREWSARARCKRMVMPSSGSTWLEGDGSGGPGRSASGGGGLETSSELREHAQLKQESRIKIKDA